MPQLLEDRRANAATKLDGLSSSLAETDALLGERACVYVTGSFGRGEAGPLSDLDVFIAGLGTDEARAFPYLDEVQVLSALVQAARAQGFPEFSDDGRFLEHHTVDSLVDALGQPEDDAENTFTARLLLLLESKPLLGAAAYDVAIKQSINAYWRDFEQHADQFLPAYLANDVLRLWRTFCVNYEARRQDEPEEARINGKVKRYKLKHSRLLTCYSALAYLLAVYGDKKTVTPDDASRMVRLTPTERLENLPTSLDPWDQVQRILSLYEQFLKRTALPKAELLEIFSDKGKSKDSFREAREFGAAVKELLDLFATDNELHTLLLV